MARRDWSKPVGVDRLTEVFPGAVTGTLLPPWEDVPEEIRKSYYRNEGWPGFVSGIFCNGGRLPPVKEGIDKEKAYSQIRACMGSWEPKHEHKIAGVAYLMSLWCEDPS